VATVDTLMAGVREQEAGVVHQLALADGTNLVATAAKDMVR